MKRHKRHSMKLTYWIAVFWVVIFLSIIIGSFIFEKHAQATFINPFIASSQGEQSESELIDWTKSTDYWVDKYSNRYGKTPSEVNHTKQLLHCLLYREAGYGSNKGKGDGGLASGPLQFWNETWNRMRNKMIKQGLISDIGNRDDMEQSIQTTAWAIVSGYSKEWGPVLRKECN